MRNQTSDIQIPHSNALPLSYRDLMVSEVYYKVLMIHVLHTARISNVGSVMFVNKIREMVSFKLGKETGKDGFFFIFSVFHTREKTKNIFLYLFTKLKPYHISYSIFKHDKLSTLLILAVCRTYAL